METSLKTGFAQIFSRCPKNLSCPKFGGAAAPLAPPARTPMVLKFPNFRDLGATDPLSAASFSNGGAHQNYECGNPGGYFRNFWVGM